MSLFRLGMPVSRASEPACTKPGPWTPKWSAAIIVLLAEPAFDRSKCLLGEMTYGAAVKICHLWFGYSSHYVCDTFTEA